MKQLSLTGLALAGIVGFAGCNAEQYQQVDGRVAPTVREITSTISVPEKLRVVKISTTEISDSGRLIRRTYKEEKADSPRELLFGSKETSFRPAEEFSPLKEIDSKYEQGCFRFRKETTEKYFTVLPSGDRKLTKEKFIAHLGHADDAFFWLSQELTEDYEHNETDNIINASSCDDGKITSGCTNISKIWGKPGSKKYELAEDFCWKVYKGKTGFKISRLYDYINDVETIYFRGVDDRFGDAGRMVCDTNGDGQRSFLECILRTGGEGIMEYDGLNGTTIWRRWDQTNGANILFTTNWGDIIGEVCDKNLDGKYEPCECGLSKPCN